MLCAQTTAIVVLLQGITTVSGQFNNFNNDYPDYFEYQRQQAQGPQFQQVFPNQQQQFQQTFPNQPSQFQQVFSNQQQQFQQGFTNQQPANQQPVINQQQSNSITNGNGGRPRPTTTINPATMSTTTPGTTTTAQPAQVAQCRQNCIITSEYNPVCGTDGQSYNNRNVLRCARSCGVNVRLQRIGPCAPRAF